jgi:hypothetical protein
MSAIMDKPTPCVDLWQLGGREKKVNLDKEGEFKTRCVMMCEDILCRIGSVITQLFNPAIKKIYDTELFIGKSFESGIYIEFSNKYLTGGSFALDPDWKGFDNNVTEQMLVVALGVLRSVFPGGKRIDNLFLYICSSLVFKFIVLDKGLVFRLSKGLPSGHPLTSIIGSLVN